MCQINNVLHNTGDKPLICYKVLLRDSETIKSAFYTHCSWKIGQTKSLNQLSFYRGGSIGQGFFHAFTNKADAYNERIILATLDSSNSYIIAEMEIPPRINYYTGITESGVNSIATRVITFKQIL